MPVDNGSVLIHCRSKYCDFPGKLFQYPQDFTAAQLYQVRAMILQTTESIEDLRQTHEKRRVILCTGTHLVMGVTAYIRDILEADSHKKSVEKGYDAAYSGTDIYADCGGRPVYGFFGFVWKGPEGEKGRYPLQIAEGFPSLESIGLLIRNHVLPKWEARYWEEDQGADYGEQVEFDLFPTFLAELRQDEPDCKRELAGLGSGMSESRNKIPLVSLLANQERALLKVYPGSLNEVMLCKTLEAAVYDGVPVSCCTGFPNLNSAGRSAFMNVSCAGRDEGRILVKRRKRKKW